MKKALAILLVAIMALSLVACNNQDQDSSGGVANPPSTGGQTNTGTGAASNPEPGAPPEPPPEGARVAEHIEIMSNNFIPAVINAFSPAGTTAPTQWILMLISDTLVTYNESEGRVEPRLAERWETNDNQHITFYLRQDIYFHNGDHVTAEDVKWTIETSREFPGTVAYERWNGVSDINIIDEYTIELTLNAPNGGIFAFWSMPSGGVYSSRAFNEDPDNWFWVGTGPYTITEFSTNEFVTLERNDNFWGDPPPTKSMTFRYVPEETVRTVMMQNKDFHFSLGIQANDFELFRADPEFVVLPRTLTSPLSIGFNMTDPITGDWNFRMAVCHALNGLDIGVVAEGVDGTSDVDGNVWGKSTAYRRDDIPRIPQDLDLARQYLAESVYNGETIEIAAGAPPFIRGAEMVQEQLAQIGIPVVINAMDQPGLFAHLAFGNNRSQLHFFCPEMTFDPFMSARNNFTPAPTNRSSYTNPVVTELIERAEATTDANIHREIFYEIQGIVAQDVPWYPCVWREFGDVGVAGIGGFGASGTATYLNFRGIYLLLDD